MPADCDPPEPCTGIRLANGQQWRLFPADARGEEVVRRIAGFDFLGYRLHPVRRLRPSVESINRLKIRARRLYEQGASVERL